MKLIAITFAMSIAIYGQAGNPLIEADKTTGIITGTPRATTQSPADNSTKLSTTAYADAAAAAKLTNPMSAADQLIGSAGNSGGTATGVGLSNCPNGLTYSEISNSL